MRQKKKDKFIALKSTQEESLDLEEDDDHDVALLTKNFNKFFSKRWVNDPNLVPRHPNLPKVKIPSNIMFLLTKIKVFNIRNVMALDTFNPNVSNILKKKTTMNTS